MGLVAGDHIAMKLIATKLIAAKLIATKLLAMDRSPMDRTPMGSMVVPRRAGSAVGALAKGLAPRRER